MGLFCLLVKYHWELSAPEACAAALFLHNLSSLHPFLTPLYVVERRESEHFTPQSGPLVSGGEEENCGFFRGFLVKNILAFPLEKILCLFVLANETPKNNY